MINEAIVLVISLAALAKFSDFTIKNAIRFSYLSGINQLAIGFIIIAVATSLPELTIAIISSIENQGILSMGNVFGANIANLALIFGLLSFFGFRMSKNDKTETNRILLLTIIIAIFILALQKIDLAFGLFLLIMFYISSRTIFKKGIMVRERRNGIKTIAIVKSLFYLLFSIAAVIISANFVVDSVVRLSSMVGIATAIFGATVVSIGTTIPEMSVAIAAIRRKNIELAVGDGMGSVITNITIVLGAATLINPISMNHVTTVALLCMVITSIIFMFLASRMKFGRKEGIALLLIYAAYLGIVVNFAS